MIKFLIILSILLFSSTALSEPIISDDQWNKNTKLWLARAFVSEAGWDSRNDHIAIAYVLKRRWENARIRWSNYRYVDMIKQYCSGLRSMPFTYRQRWIRELSLESTRRPQKWPKRLRWTLYSGKWKRVLERAEHWRMGKFSDLCRRAMHWGSPQDVPGKNFRVIKCGRTKNIFYRMEKR